MIDLKFHANRLSGLFGLRLKRGSRGRHRGNNRQLPSVAAEVSLLEQRCLMSVKGAGALHAAAHEVAQQRTGGQNMVTFAGYEWYTNYHHNLDSGFHNNGQQWAPQNSFVVNGQLHLTLREATVDNKYTALSSSEVVLVATDTGQPFHPGYGTYLVSAETAGNFDRLASNNGAIFGAFTYEGLRGNGRVASNRITGVNSSVLATLHPGMSVVGVDYKGTKFFAPGTTIRQIQGGTIILNEAAVHAPRENTRSISRIIPW